MATFQHTSSRMTCATGRYPVRAGSLCIAEPKSSISSKPSTNPPAAYPGGFVLFFYVWAISGVSLERKRPEPSKLTITTAPVDVSLRTGAQNSILTPEKAGKDAQLLHD